jgi:hypothetical protein
MEVASQEGASSAGARPPGSGGRLGKFSQALEPRDALEIRLVDFGLRPDDHAVNLSPGALAQLVAIGAHQQPSHIEGGGGKSG